jgi:glucose-1-phosphate thymidylyltransferase
MKCTIGPDTYIGPYTSIGDNCTICGCELENSIIMKGTKINCKKRIVDSLIGAYSTIESSELLLPKGDRLIIGDHSRLLI